MSEPRGVFALDEEKAALLGRVLPPVRPEPARLEASFRRLVAAAPAPRPRWRARVAVAGAVLLVSGVSLAGYRIFEARRLPYALPPPVAVRPPERFVTEPVIAPRASRPPTSGSRAASVSPSASAFPARARNKTRLRPAPVPSDLEKEAACLAAPMTRIRRGGDLVSALTEIDEYLRRFPAGTLRPEAKLLRVDALLLLRRSGPALAALEELDLDDNRRGLELRLVRGELRAQTDCRAALPDFDAVLRARPSPDLTERARRDRSDCVRRLQATP